MANYAHWRSMAELPTTDEVMSAGSASLPENPIDVPHGDKSKYLETQYTLLRHEGVEPLRRSVETFRNNPHMEDSPDTAVYTGAYVQGYTPTRIGTFCRIGFSTQRCARKIRWEHSSRLTPGSVVALSPNTDNFRSVCCIATVASRSIKGGLEPDEQEDPRTPCRIEIIWADVDDAILDPMVKFVMIESKSGYFEAVRYTMRGLQVWAREETRFDKYIVHGDTEARKPEYMERKGGCLNLACLAKDRGTSEDMSVSVDEPFPKMVEDATKMDRSQLEAVRKMVTTELAVIQGPPGTGKTYTSVSFLTALLSNQVTERPIIIAAQTNHALDQLLILIDEVVEPTYVRLGGRSRNEDVNMHTLYHLRQAASTNIGGGDTGRIESRLRSYTRNLQNLVRECFGDELIDPNDLVEAGLITQEQYDSVADSEWEETVEFGTKNPLAAWLGEAVEKCEEPRYDRAATGDWEDMDDYDGENRSGSLDDEERDRPSAVFIAIEENWTGKVNERQVGPALWNRMQRVLETRSDLYQTPINFRGAMYRYLRKKLLKIKTEELRQLLREGDALVKDAKAARTKANFSHIMELDIPIIGCTTTGLTKYRDLISRLKPQIMLIEEAAETREANITSALFPTLEQVILVGDHMQLVPHTDVRALADHPYNLHVSLFERLVKVAIGHSVLTIQRRMVPEIREILMPFYATLTDHPLVKDRRTARPYIGGMGTLTSFFFHHDWPERVTQTFSRINMDEAMMIVGFVRYLVQNGAHPKRITVLTFYRGQRALIRDRLNRDIILSSLYPQKPFNVFTVDGYQGEENDIIILSLVRSPMGGYDFNVGFLDDQNRVVVALSRARRGLYIFGNHRNLMQASPKAAAVWRDATNTLVTQNRCEQYFPITCQNHSQEVRIQGASDWEGLHGGCRLKCPAKLSCRHSCGRNCHPDGHEKIRCIQSCQRVLPGCGHRCSEICADPCKCIEGNDCGKAGKKKATNRAPYQSLDDLLDSGVASVGDSETVQESQTEETGKTNTELMGFEKDTTIRTRAQILPTFPEQDPAIVSSNMGQPNSSWATWDAYEADTMIREKRIANKGERDKLSLTKGSGPVIKSKFIQVRVTSDARREVIATHVDNHTTKPESWIRPKSDITTPTSFSNETSPRVSPDIELQSGKDSSSDDGDSSQEDLITL